LAEKPARQSNFYVRENKGNFDRPPRRWGKQKGGDYMRGKQGALFGRISQKGVKRLASKATKGGRGGG